MTAHLKNVFHIRPHAFTKYILLVAGTHVKLIIFAIGLQEHRVASQHRVEAVIVSAAGTYVKLIMLAMSLHNT